jgi:hypothetical protein
MFFASFLISGAGLLLWLDPVMKPDEIMGAQMILTLQALIFIIAAVIQGIWFVIKNRKVLSQILREAFE